MKNRRCRMPEASGRYSGRQGYLLVEVLATMTISAFVLVALGLVVALTEKAFNRTTNKSEEIEGVSRVMAALDREIAAIAPIRWPGENAGFVFQGNSKSIAFARETVLPDGTSDDHVVFLQQNGMVLTRSELPLLPGYLNFGYMVAAGVQKLFQSRYSVSFAYFAEIDNGQEALTETWTRADRLPVAVRISLSNADGRLLGSTRVAVHVDAEPGCADPARGVCTFRAPASADAEQPEAEPQPVDADDNLGWARYAK